MAKKKAVKKSLVKKGIPTRRLLAAWLFTTEPDIEDIELSEILDGVDFPGDTLARPPTSRYRTLFNQGKLPPPTTDPRTW